MSELLIRKAVKEDSKKIMFFIKELAKFEKLENRINTSAEELELNIFEKKYAEVLILDVDNLMIGFALYFYTFSTFEGQPTLYLEDLFIIPEKRHMGYGKKTLEFLANEAIRKDCARVEWSCLDWNIKAIDFYKNFGAMPQVEWTLFRLDGKSLIRYKK